MPLTLVMAMPLVAASEVVAGTESTSLMTEKMSLTAIPAVVLLLLGAVASSLMAIMVTAVAVFQRITRRKRQSAMVERVKVARLEAAEAHLSDLRERADKAVRVLDARRSRNHWRESIEQMIQGA